MRTCEQVAEIAFVGGRYQMRNCGNSMPCALHADENDCEREAAEEVSR